MFNCFCGYFGLSHHCTRKIKGIIKITACPEDYKLCEKEVYIEEFISLRWKKNMGGYDVCGSCHDKLGCSPICENCFCTVCYVSLTEHCSCLK